MPLSDDQKAMLRLLAQREQGYEDLAALMGLSVDEVRAKVGDALSQLEAEGEPAPALPAEPTAPEPVAETPAPEPEATPEPPAPPAETSPSPEPAPAAPVAAAPAPKRTPPPRPKLSLPGSGGAKAAIVAGAAVLVLLVVILVVGGGDSDDSGGSGDTTAVETGTNANAANNPDITQAVLQATDGSDAAGVASFGRVKNSLVLQVEATGLEPTGKGESYTVWLAQSPQKMLPLATTPVDADGKIGAQTEVPAEVLGYLANETFTKIVVTRTENAALQASLKKATAAKSAPKYTGSEVLNGTVTGPIVGAASREEAAE